MEYFSEGLTEELINALSNIPPLRVVSRTTVFQFKNYAGDIRELGRRLNVDAILEGTVRRQDDRIKVIAQLNSVQDGYNYWSKTWDNKIGDFFEIQEEIAKQLARSLRPSEAGVVNAGRPLTTDPEAYTLYIKGQFHRRRSSETEVKTAVGFYQQAIARDPRFAEAYVGLAIVLSEAGTSGLLSPSEAVPEAKAAVAKALELNPLLASAYAAQGSIALHYDWDWAAARQNLERAIELDPTDAETHHSYSHFLLVMGRFPESLAESLRAIELDPLNAGMHGHLVLHYACAREFPMAIEAAKTAIGIDPASKQTWRFKLSVHEFLGEFENAIDARSGMGEPRELTETLRTGLTTAGPLGYWAAVRDSELKKTDAQVDALMLAHAYARLGQSREAMDWLERMFRDRIGSLVYLNINIDFDSIRNDPRFKDLIKRIGLPAPR
jgi:TolB-like protein